ncbi:hypothetical protein, partial [Streptomyces sp. LUP47B]
KERADAAIGREEAAEQDAEEQRAGRESALRDLRTLRAGIRAAGGDPTTIQNLWAQLRLRNRQWAEAKREARLTRSMLEAEGGDVALVDEMTATVAKAEGEAREAQAAIERVRNLRGPIAEALERADYRQDMRRGDLADSIMPAILAALDGTEQPTSREQPGTQAPEADNPRTVCVCGHTRGEHLRVSGRLLCDACDPNSTA